MCTHARLYLVLPETLVMVRKMNRYVIDTDGGVDDAVALLVALRLSDVRVEVITTVAGNVGIKQSTANTLRVLEQLRLTGVTNLPLVAQGESMPLRVPQETATHVHGDDGLGNVAHMFKYDIEMLSGDSAVNVLVDLACTYGEGLTLVTLGPLTNVARAVLKAPDVMRGVGGVVMMGGCFDRKGNTTPVSEFNVYVDPHAVQVVLNSGMPITIVPLDVTEQVRLMRTDLDLFSGAPFGPFLEAVTESYMRFHEVSCGFYGCYVHDALAVAVAFDDGLVEKAVAHVAVEAESRVTRGAMVAEFNEAGQTRCPVNAQVCINIDESCFHEWMGNRLLL